MSNNLSRNTTAPAAETVHGFPILDASQRRRLAQRLREITPLPADATHAAAALTVGADATAEDALTATWGDLNTPNLIAATSEADYGKETRVVGWWQGIGLPLFRIGDWTPNGADVYRITYAEGWSTAQEKFLPAKPDKVIEWPTATLAADGAWEVKVTKPVRDNLPTGAHATALGKPRTLAKDDDGVGVFAGGLVRIPVVFVRYLDGHGKVLGKAWVAIAGHAALRTAAAYGGGSVAGIPSGVDVEELREQVAKRGYNRVPRATSIALIHHADPTVVAASLAARPTRVVRDDAADVAKAFAACRAGTPNPIEGHTVDEFFATASLASVVTTLAVAWQVTAATAKKRTVKVLSDRGSDLRMLTLDRVRGDWSALYAHGYNGKHVAYNQYAALRLVSPGSEYLEAATVEEPVTFAPSRGSAVLVVPGDEFDTWWEKRLTVLVDAVKEKAAAQTAERLTAQQAAFAALPEAEQKQVRLLATLAEESPSNVHYTPNSRDGNAAALITLFSDDIARLADLLEKAGVTPAKGKVRLTVSTD